MNSTTNKGSYKNLYLLLIYFILLVNIAHSQIKVFGSDKLSSILNTKRSLLETEKSADSLFNSYKRPIQDSLLASEMHEFGKWLYKKDIDKAIFYTKKALKIRTNSKESNPASFKSSLGNLAVFYNAKKDPINSIKYHTELLKILKDSPLKNNVSWRLANNYRVISDFYNSEILLDQVSRLSIQQKNYNRLFHSYIQSASVHFNLGDQKNYDLGITKALKADSLSMHLKNVSIADKLKVYSLLGSLYKRKKDTSRAISYYNKVITSGKKHKQNIHVGKAYIDIKELIEPKKGIDTALVYLDNALKYVGNKRNLKAIIHHNKAWTYFNHNKISKALDNSNKALQQIISNKTNTSKNNLPDYNDLQINPYKFVFLEILKDNVKFNQELFKENHDDSLLKNALKISYLADQLVDIIRLETFGKQANLFWKNDASDLYLDAIKNCFLLNQPEKALYFFEKSKALLLLEDISYEQLRRVHTISDSITSQEFLLKKDIADIQNKLDRYSNTNAYDSIQTILFKAKQKHLAFIDSLDIKHPQYSNAKKTSKIKSLQEAQNYAKENNTSFIHYVLDNEQGFGLVINEQSVKIFEIQNIKKLQQDILQFSALISKPLHSKKDFIEYKEVSKRIYHSIVPDKIRSLLTEKITVISDHTIYKIPLEALLDTNDDYLIKNYEINYAYSISFLLQNKKLKRVSEKDFLGFAPVQYAYDLPDLEGTKAEVNQIGETFNSTLLLNKQASKQNLIHELSKYKIIHLSTHADANDSITPWIAGVNEKITLNDIYATKNNAELVVLSACNTSIGAIEEGEGVMSLTRGFFNTGANSVISTLWRAEDKATLEITTNFYKHLKKGKSKSASLRMAKLEYLNNHTLRKASPYYWSLLVLVGDPDPIYHSLNPWFIMSIIIISLLLLYFIYKKQKPRSKY